MEIVAEGVETETEAIVMTQFGCSELQGYFFSRPIDKDQLIRLLETYEPKVIPSERNNTRNLAQHSAAA